MRPPPAKPLIIGRGLRYTLWFGAIWFTLHSAVTVVDGLCDNLTPADAAVVLGNAVEANGVPSVCLQARLDRALKLYQDGLVKALIVSGGMGDNRYDEATVMRDYLVARGVPESAVSMDHRGVTTFETARHTPELLKARGLKTVLVVTQYWHISRAKLALARFGLPGASSAHAALFEWRDAHMLVREFIGYYYYLARGK